MAPTNIAMTLPGPVLAVAAAALLVEPELSDGLGDTPAGEATVDLWQDGAVDRAVQLGAMLVEVLLPAGISQ